MRNRRRLVLAATVPVAMLTLASPAFAQYNEGACEAGTICVGDAMVTEGNSGTTAAVFTVSAPSDSAVTVNYETMADATATAGVDFQPTSGTLAIPAGGTVQVTVLVNGDTAPEPNELFHVHLSGATGATISKHHGAGTINDDDGGGGALPEDTTPPNTVIHGGPGRVTRARRASFHLMANEAYATFRCKVDARPWRACTESVTLRRLAVGRHTFRARAIDQAGNVDPTPALKTWRIRR